MHLVELRPVILTVSAWYLPQKACGIRYFSAKNQGISLYLSQLQATKHKAKQREAKNPMFYPRFSRFCAFVSICEREKLCLLITHTQSVGG
jgi:hypothetical protein